MTGRNPLLQELRRRHVFRVAVVYAATAFVVLQAADIMLPRLGVPDWIMSLVVALVVLGFPVALVLAWALELKPGGGVRRTDGSEPGTTADIAPILGRRAITIAALLVVAGVGLSTAWWLRPAVTPDTDNTARAEAQHRASVAVLPFDSLSADPEQGYFADGLTEEILNSLASLPRLLVTARTSSFYYKDKDVPVDEIAGRLGVDHVLEGSVRRSGEQVRVTAQLVRANDGFHVWSNTYDRPVDDVFAVQTDIAEKVATALGILLDERERARMEGAGVRDPEAYALFARGFELYQVAHGGAPQIPTLMQANAYFDQATGLAPALWAASYHSADLYSHVLLELAGGADPASLPEPVRTGYQEEHERRLHDALAEATNPAARDFIGITRSVFSDDWTGLGARVRRAFDHTESCGHDQWMHIAGPAFGHADAAREFFLRGTRCNAIDESNWLHATIASLYAGEPERALAIAEQGLEVADVQGFGLEEFRLFSLIALGRLDEARAAVARLEGFNTSRQQGEAWLAAARGDTESLEAISRALAGRESGLPGLGARIQFAARAGDREGTNAYAAAVDARPAGPTLLMIATYFCICGAPFDLDVTPNLAARLDEAGLEWPPVATIDWPLKDW